MTDDIDQVKRLNALEIRIAHQDNVIDELNEIAARQWSEIQGLNETINNFKNKLQELENGINAPLAQDTPPPHF